MLFYTKHTQKNLIYIYKMRFILNAYYKLNRCSKSESYKQADIIEAFNWTSRYLDNFRNIDNR